MGYQSKTYSLSDEVIERLEAEKAKGISPNQFLLAAIAHLDSGSIPAMDRALNLHAKAQMEFTTQHVRADTSDRPVREKRIAALAAWEDAKTAALRSGEADEFPKFIKEQDERDSTTQPTAVIKNLDLGKLPTHESKSWHRGPRQKGDKSR